MAKIWLHDSAGHPFLSEFGRRLALRGHTITYSYLPEFASPKGRLTELPDDSATFSIRPVRLGRAFPKYNYVKRWFAERRYGRLLCQAVAEKRPDIVVSANISLDMGRQLQAVCRRHHLRYIHWLQDLYGPAVGHILGKRFGRLGRWLARYYTALERQLLRCSDHVIAITEDFLPFLAQAKVAPNCISIIENWAPLNELPVQPKQNTWARRHALDEAFVFMYSGTMGMKHDPRLMVALCRAFADQPDVRIVVVSEGPGAEWLTQQKREQHLNNLLVMPFQPYDEVPEMMGAADVLLVVLEHDAGAYSVPSKTLSYLCAARAILMSAPDSNLAAKTLQRAKAGLICDPRDINGWIQQARCLHANAELRRHLGAQGRLYAETHFDLNGIAQRFEDIVRPLTPEPALASPPR